MTTPRNLPVLAAAVALSVFGIASAATTTSPKIVISNMTGQEIPLETGSSVQFGSNGDLSVRCRVDNNGNCPSIGSGSSGGGYGTNPPTLTLTPSTTSLTAGAAFSLTWNSTAEVCYGAGPSGVTNWSGRQLAPSGSQSLTLSQGNYAFSMRCYSATGLREATTATVVVDAATNPTPTGYCAEYYGPIKPVPTDLAFTAYGFSAVEKTFQEIWGVQPGASAPKVGIPGNFVVPVTDATTGGRYLAIPFALTHADGTYLSQIRLSWVEAQQVGTTTGKITLTVSPCSGDFRAPVSGSSDPYLTPSCRVTAAAISGNLNIATIGSGLSGCPIPANKTLYLNIATFEMYNGSKPTASTCSPGATSCGVAMRNE